MTTLASLLRQFIEAHGQDMDRIGGAKLEDACRMAHTIKGTGATLGLTRLSQSAAQLETALRQGEAPTSLIDACRNELTTLHKALGDLVTETEPDAITEADPAEVKAVLDELAALLKRSDASAISQFEHHRGLIRHALGQAITEQLARLLKRFELLEAMEMLQAARKQN